MRALVKASLAMALVLGSVSSSHAAAHAGYGTSEFFVVSGKVKGGTATVFAIRFSQTDTGTQWLPRSYQLGIGCVAFSTRYWSDGACVLLAQDDFVIDTLLESATLRIRSTSGRFRVPMRATVTFKATTEPVLLPYGYVMPDPPFLTLPKQLEVGGSVGIFREGTSTGSVSAGWLGGGKLPKNARSSLQRSNGAWAMATT